jgi:hypothetical protein
MHSKDEQFYCFHCGFNANIEIVIRPCGEFWLCKCCGLHGFVSDYDAPRFISPSEQGDTEPTYDFDVRLFSSDVGKDWVKT